ncbi:Acetyltransferase (GNAT) domain-containing protein [Streptomyces sp. DvalAA-14]|uniref:GNAT family N-acetyltransferase n=1 Tax=unclassified Streptomyces TaxID=2593676 RepID=UPI00081B01BC|nr:MULTISPECIES: GNAT family N-acetyltransferase [unclassified Streptomyces]MYS20806.1 GNAT family N-acetyltransferase [Streptomyces sp. SID4948]SCD77664.1 Acetyltransferase (GNAT) domain-containing protein [Streptomyces sp. DvalAA-14]
MTYVITAAHPDDAATLGPLHLRNWLRNYLNPDAGIDESWIREHRGSSATAEGVTQWREFIEVANQPSAPHFCRVVRSETDIVGYLCGHREESVTLGPMYLLDQAQGHGLGGHMMTEFLTWAGPSRIRLGVTEYNERAIRFYRRHGFEVAGERYLWRGRLPTLPMTREPPSAAGFS